MPLDVPAFCVKVILLLPRASPRDVPVKGDAAPAPVISMKSAFVNETAAAVSLRAVPVVFDLTRMRFTVEFPVTLSVPVIVWSAAK